jgi:hypothetical protein
MALAACVSPEYHQTREQLRPTAIGFHIVFDCSKIQRNNMASRPMSLESRSARSGAPLAGDLSGLSDLVPRVGVERIARGSSIGTVQAMNMGSAKFRLSANSKAKILPSTCREGPACLASRCQRGRINGLRVGRGRWSGEPAKLRGCGDFGMNQVPRLFH